MKKIILFPTLLFIFACSQDDPKLNNSDSHIDDISTIDEGEEIVQKFYEYHGREYIIDFILQGNSAKPIKDQKDYNFVQSLLDNPETAVYFNPGTSQRIIFKTESELNDYLEKEKNDAPDMKNNISSRQQLIDPLTVFKDGTYSGESISLSNSISDLRTIGFNDNISSLQTAALPSGRQIILHEHPNYSGKKIVIEPRGINVNLACLCDFKIGSSGPGTIYIIGGAGVDPGSVCGWFCNSWNDETTSISFSPFIN